MSAYANEASELKAIAGLIGDKEGHYDRLREEDGELIEERFTPGGVDEKTVATGVKPGTSAVYIPRKNKRVVVALSPANTVQYYVFDNESDEWEEEVHEVGNAASNLHPKTQLAAGYTATGIVIIYQDAQGKLGYASTPNGDTWTHGGTLPAVNPVPGTPLAATNLASAPDQLRVYYISNDESVHYLLFPESGSPTDHPVSYANVGGTAYSNLIVRPTQEEPHIFTLGNDRTINLYNKAQKALVGTLDESGELELANKEECGFWGGGYGGPIFIGGTHYHRW